MFCAPRQQSDVIAPSHVRWLATSKPPSRTTAKDSGQTPSCSINDDTVRCPRGVVTPPIVTEASSVSVPAAQRQFSVPLQYIVMIAMSPLSRHVPAGGRNVVRAVPFVFAKKRCTNPGFPGVAM